MICTKQNSPKAKYIEFINSNLLSYEKDNKTINKENAIAIMSNINDAEKRKMTTFDLNIYYYFMNGLFKKYISKKDMIIKFIDNYIALNNRHNALSV